MTTPELEAEITRLHFAEHWPIGTIATQLAVHPDVVRRVLGIGDARAAGGPRPRMVDPYRDFITETLERYPRLRSTRLYDMLRERGYKGAPRTLREYVALVRPRPRREVYLRTEPLPGEQAQIDWAYVGRLDLPGGGRALWLFVMVLSYSRALWGEFVLDLSVHSLCRSLVRAASALGGVTRQWLEQTGGQLQVLSLRAPGARKVSITVLAYQPRAENTKTALRKLAARTLAEFDLTGEIDQRIVPVRPQRATTPATVRP